MEVHLVKINLLCEDVAVFVGKEFGGFEVELGCSVTLFLLLKSFSEAEVLTVEGGV